MLIILKNLLETVTIFQPIRSSIYRTTLASAGRRSINTMSEGDVKKSKQTLNLLSILEKNPKRFERIRFLDKLFQTHGYEIRIAGGAVRDILSGVEPQDIDFATTARPEQSLEILSKYEDLLRIIVTAAGQRHGTVAVKFKEEVIDFKRIKLSPSPENTEPTPSKTTEPVYDQENPFEITTLRCDTFTDGRHAEVEFVNDWRIDAERRDLTINAMFLTLDNGQLIDYFDGESDLKNGIVKFVGSADLRIREDYLRILRFFRFWSRYGRSTEPDEETLTTIKKNLEGFDVISGERILTELKKIFLHSPCSEVVKQMMNIRLFENIGMTDGNSPADYDKYIQDVVGEIDLVEANITKFKEILLNKQDPTTASSDEKIKDLLPVLLISTIIRSQEMLLNVHKRLKFSNLEKDTIMYILKNRSDVKLTIECLKQQLAMMHVPERPSALIRMKGVLIYKGLFDWISELDSWPVPVFPLTGSMVAQEFGKRKLPKNKIKDVFSELKNEWAENGFQLDESQLKDKLSEKMEQISSHRESSK